MAESEQQNEQEQDGYIARMRDYAEEQYDKLIITINGGALVLTVGFVKDIVKITDETSTIALKYSWVLFTFSILCILISHRTAIITSNYALRKMEKLSKRWNIATEVLNWSALITLVTGISCFIYFVSNSI